MTSVNETNAFEARRRNRDGGIGSIVAVLAVAVSVVLGASIDAPAQGAALTAGDAFRVNFAPTGSALGGDWNNMDANSSISAGSVQLFGGGGATTIDGVGLSINGTGSANDTNTQGWGGWTSSPADPYYTAAAYPLVYSVNAGLGLTGKANELNLTVSGLDTSLRYNVRAYFLINETLADFDIRVTRRCRKRVANRHQSHHRLHHALKSVRSAVRRSDLRERVGRRPRQPHRERWRVRIGLASGLRPRGDHTARPRRGSRRSRDARACGRRPSSPSLSDAALHAATRPTTTATPPPRATRSLGAPGRRLRWGDRTRAHDEVTGCWRQGPTPHRSCAAFRGRCRAQRGGGVVVSRDGRLSQA